MLSVLNGVDGFPASVFRIEGDPAVVRASAAAWDEFGFQATESAELIRALDTSLFVGPEGDTYREGLDHDLVPHLDTTAAAYGGVGTALGTFARDLADLQDQIAPLTIRAPHLWADVATARAGVDAAIAADQWHQLTPEASRDQLRPGGDVDPYESHTGAARSALGSAQQAWDQCLAQAQDVQTELRAAIGRCCRRIADAAATRFAHNPHGLAALAAGVTSFVTDHAAGLARISSALKIVSAVSGVLAFVPVIDIVAAPLALATAAGALAIDATLKATTGEGSWTSIGIDAALIALPGAAKLTTITRADRAATRIAEARPEGATDAYLAVSLKEQLSLESARSLFTPEGRLTSDGIPGAKRIMPGEDLGNAALVKKLTADGSRIDNWAKYSTETHQSPYGDFRVHFYMNHTTGEVHYESDFKVKFNGRQK